MNKRNAADARIAAAAAEVEARKAIREAKRIADEIRSADIAAEAAVRRAAAEVRRADIAAVAKARREAQRIADEAKGNKKL